MTKETILFHADEDERANYTYRGVADQTVKLDMEKRDFGRVQTEFWCDPAGGGCSRYFSTFLRSNMNGAFTIKCPHDGKDLEGNPLPSPANKECNHDHYRVIQNGLITGTRDYKAKDHGHIILGLKSTLRDTPEHDCPEYRRSLLKRVK
jgi:hypothetical protein